MDTIAAVDLGSNSFHLVIARQVDPELRIIDRCKEQVRLAAGLDSKKKLTEEAQTRALECLERFGQRLSEMDAPRVRAVGTNTLRRARNGRKFLKRARQALGHRVEIVSGLEEARLIYLGVAHSVSDDFGRRLVIDIGGGSTECILGERFTPLESDSLHMGCVSYSQRFFASGEIKRKAMKQAVLTARRELQTIERRFRGMGWDTAIGASGTVQTVAEVLKSLEWTDGSITRTALIKLRDKLVDKGHVDRLADLPGVKERRAAVLPGGVGILLAVFEAFRLESMTPCRGALREGVLYDLVGRIRHEDVRDRTIRRFLERYHIDLPHASRVERTAQYLLTRLGPGWGLTDDESRRMLSWAAKLHEIGMLISYTSYHKHGGYLARNSFMPGFSRDDQELLAALIRTHRRKLTSAEVNELQALKQLRVRRLMVVLRLAVLLNRSRSKKALPYFDVRAEDQTVTLSFPSDWIDDHPLTRADLTEEAAFLAARDITLAVELREP